MRLSSSSPTHWGPRVAETSPSGKSGTFHSTRPSEARSKYTVPNTVVTRRLALSLMSGR
jgi:hypothetical protein